MKPILIDVDETDIVDGKLPVFDSWSASIHLAGIGKRSGYSTTASGTPSYIFPAT